MDVLLARDSEHAGDTFVLEAADEQLGDGSTLCGHVRSVTTGSRELSCAQKFKACRTCSIAVSGSIASSAATAA